MSGVSPGQPPAPPSPGAVGGAGQGGWMTGGAEVPAGSQLSGRQVPIPQNSPWAQALSQPPQLVGSLIRSTHTMAPVGCGQTPIWTWTITPPGGGGGRTP